MATVSIENVPLENVFDAPQPRRRTNNALINWRFTLNNYRDEDFEYLTELYMAGKFKYIIFGKEVAPNTGTPHLQGFLQLPKKLRFAQVKKILGSKYHLDPADFPAAARDYCKKDGEWQELGSFVKQACIFYE